MTRILLIGQQGQVAWELQRTLATLGELFVAGRDTLPYSVDLSQPESIGPLVDAIQPDWIVNAAAYTSVDKAEQEEATATTINAQAVGVLAIAAQRVGALLVHYSTDYVFDGTSTQPYTEDMPTGPQSAYGRSKLAGEQAILRIDHPHLILRTSWVYGVRGSNFMRTIRRLARERNELRIVADQHGCPTWSRHIAEATAQILAQIGQNTDTWNAKGGIYHLVSSGQGSWYDFATRIVEHQRQHEAIKAERLFPIRTEDYPLPAPRPGYSVLSTEKLNKSFGIYMPHWESALEQVQNDLNIERN